MLLNKKPSLLVNHYWALFKPKFNSTSLSLSKRGSLFNKRNLATISSQNEPPLLPARLRLQSGQTFNGTSFGAPIVERSVSGEVVFTTSLVGYPESMTDPSYRGQILVFTQPLIGNYGVPARTLDQFGLLTDFESERIHVKGIIVNDYALKYSHWKAVESLGQWCAREGVFALSGVDTRAIVTVLRERGTTLGKLSLEQMQEEESNAQVMQNSGHDLTDKLSFDDASKQNLVAQVSTAERKIYHPQGKYKIALLDCGVKFNIIRLLAQRGAQVHRLPWNHDITNDFEKFDGLFISNGPGDPIYCSEAVHKIREVMKKTSYMPIFGICMGNQLLGMAAGYKTYKLPYGNRGHNQPALNLVNGKCVITSQNHGYALNDTVQIKGWTTFFKNANDGSNEGIRHVTLPYRSVQFHPEAKGGPRDTEYLFDEFMQQVDQYKFNYNTFVKNIRQAKPSALSPPS